jgi:hypothetical protein
MATQTYTDDVEILGSEDETQLVVRGNDPQTNPLQEWQDSGSTGLAQVTNDGRLRVGGDLDLAAPSALVEGNRTVDPSTDTIKQGIQSLGVADGGVTEIDESLVWSSIELELEGSGGVSGMHSAQRAHIINANTGDASNAELRALDAEVLNEGGSSGTPVGQITGLRAAVSNAEDAYLDTAIGVEVDFNNAGNIDHLYGVRVPDVDAGATDNYAFHSGKGLVHFADVVEVGVPATLPTDSPSSFMRVYPKSDGKLYARNWLDEEYDLTGGSGGSSDFSTILSDGNGDVLTDGNGDVVTH